MFKRIFKGKKVKSEEKVNYSFEQEELWEAIGKHDLREAKAAIRMGADIKMQHPQYGAVLNYA